MCKFNTIKINKVPVEIGCFYYGRGNDFIYRIVYSFYSCEVEYDIFDTRYIRPLADHYEPEEIEKMHPDILEEIDKYHKEHKIELFDKFIRYYSIKYHEV